MWHLLSQVSLARKIRELEAQVAWDQKQMEHEMEEIKISAVSLKRINSSRNIYIYIFIYINSFTVAGRAGSEEPVEAH